MNLKDGMVVRYIGESGVINLFDDRCNTVRFLNNGEVGTVDFGRELTEGEIEHEIAFGELTTDYIEIGLVFEMDLNNFENVEDF